MSRFGCRRRASRTVTLQDDYLAIGETDSDRYEREEAQDVCRAAVDRLLDRLDWRERRILEHRHGIDGLQMTGIGYPVHAQSFPVARPVLASRALVILHIAATQDAAWIYIFKSGKNVLWRNAYSKGHYREPPAMAHGHHAGIRA